MACRSADCPVGRWVAQRTMARPSSQKSAACMTDALACGGDWGTAMTGASVLPWLSVEREVCVDGVPVVPHPRLLLWHRIAGQALGPGHARRPSPGGLMLPAA
jgi:hypothetical protein